MQRRAARFATGDYQRTSSVTSMLQQLQWQSLQTRRERTQVVMLYRIVYRLVDIPAESYLQPASLRTRGHTLRFLVPHSRTTVYKTSFFPQAIRLWKQITRRNQWRPRPWIALRPSCPVPPSSRPLCVFNFLSFLTCTVYRRSPSHTECDNT